MWVRAIRGDFTAVPASLSPTREQIVGAERQWSEKGEADGQARSQAGLQKPRPEVVIAWTVRSEARRIRLTLSSRICRT